MDAASKGRHCGGQKYQGWCALRLSRERGVMVTVFKSGKGAGGRVSQQREVVEDGKELLFDHGAPYFMVNDAEVAGFVSSWEARGLVAESKEKFGCFDVSASRFVHLGEEYYGCLESMGTKMTPPASFYRFIYSEIEEIGWEHLVRLEKDLSSLCFRVFDKKKQSHILEIQLPQSYPNLAPLLSADIPYICQLQWSRKSRLNDVVYQFTEHLEKFQEFWSVMSEIDKSLLVIDPLQPSRSVSSRLIRLGNDTCMLIFVNVNDPKALPECRFLGPDSVVDCTRKKWRINGKKWRHDQTFLENLTIILETTLPGPPNVSNDSQQVDCGICYAQYLPVDDELGAMSGSAPDYTCDYPNCRKAFHSVCLRDWLRSITTTRQSFQVLFGKCPYCNEPVSVNVDSST